MIWLVLSPNYLVHLEENYILSWTFSCLQWCFKMNHYYVMFISLVLDHWFRCFNVVGVMFTWLFNGRVCRFKCVLLLPNRMLRQDPTTSPSSPSSSHSVERCDPACSEHHARITLYTWSRVPQIILSKYQPTYFFVMFFFPIMHIGEHYEVQQWTIVAIFCVWYTWFQVNCFKHI